MSALIAIFMDSFRLLQARRLFWISFGISMLVALVYASIGFDSKGMTMFFGWKHFENETLRMGTPEAASFYVMLFTDWIVGWWLAWFALGLALISTAGIFPDFISEGSIGISLSKPVSRLRIFLLKFVGGLLFVALQMAVFTLIVYLAIGLRIGEWNLTIFWAVPLVTFVFGLLYSVAVFIGVWSRSTLFALLGTLALWIVSWLTHWTEEKVYIFAHMIPESGVSMDFKKGNVNEGEEELDKNQTLVKSHQVVQSIGMPLPKTRDCTLYLKRMIRMKERDSMLSGMSLTDLLSGAIINPLQAKAAKKAEERHSPWYVFGTSTIFGCVVLSVGALIFCRRDY